jgi:hypothetical protein
MLKKTLTILAFLSINLVFAQFAANQNFSSNTTSNFSKYATNTINIQGFNSSKSSSLQSPYYAYQDSTTTKEKWYKTDTGTSLLVAGGLIATGTAMHFATDFKVGVRDEINRYLPDFHDPIDDYTQYLPYAAVFAFDAAGIRSQHSSLRKVSTIGTAIVINLIVVQGLKYGIAEPRPDGSSNNSFPSGHTATAFMGAHIFHKEYKHRSPFYSIAAYAVASFTGVFRQLNNRHWISDVFAGAGIGIGTTELAYFLNDGWWKEKGINEIEETNRIINESKPSFIGVKVGYASLVERSDGQGLSSKSGFRISTEGAYFLTKNIGIGGEIGFQSFPISIDDGLQREFKAFGYELIPEATGNQMYYGGLYYQIPFGKNSIGAKLLAGAISGPNTELSLRELNQTFDETEEAVKNEILYADFDPKTSFSFATGIYYKRLISQYLSVGLYVDFNIGDIEYSVVELDQIIPDGEPTYLDPVSLKIKYDSYSIGGSVNIMLW